MEDPIYDNVIIFSHHPFIRYEKFEFDLSFDDDEIDRLKNYIDTSGWDKVIKNFAGHIHGGYDPYSLIDPAKALLNGTFMNANIRYDHLDDKYQIPGDFDAITTEALIVASNEQDLKGIIRLVKLHSTSSEGSIDSYDNFFGIFDAINPSLKIRSEKLLYNTFMVNFTILPFTGHEIFKRFNEIHYSIEVTGANPIVGENPIHKSWDLSQDFKHYILNPIQFRHYYKLKPNEEQKEFTVKLTMSGQTLENMPVVEVLEKKVVISKSDPLFLSFISFCPVDLEIIDPEGLIINKFSNEIDEFDTLNINFIV